MVRRQLLTLLTKLMIILSTLGTTSRCFAATQSTDTITIEQLKEHYDEFSGVEVIDGPKGMIISPIVEKVPDGNLFAQFINTSKYFLGYLLRNGAQKRAADLPTSEARLENLKRAYVHVLKSDKQFNELLLPVLAQYLRSRKIEVTGFNATTPKEVRLHDAMNVVV